jgi:hypothetical protein
MRWLSLLLIVPTVAACSTRSTPEPSLAPRAAEAIDPRLPIPDTIPAGTVDPALAARLSALVDEVRTGSAQFGAQAAEADGLAAAAGPIASESWVAAQSALSRLVEQYGVTTRAAADIDALAAERLASQHWMRPADREAIAAAAAEVAAISDSQSASIGRLTDQLER